MKQVEIIIKGRPHSKKNSREARKARNKKTGKVYSYTVPGQAYENFKDEAMWGLKKIKDRFPGDIRIDYVFYRKGKERQDVDNAICSINDVLQDAEIISDDANIRRGSFDIIPGGKEWYTVVRITDEEIHV